jgi:hypothetical protein
MNVLKHIYTGFFYALREKVKKNAFFLIITQPFFFCPRFHH